MTLSSFLLPFLGIFLIEIKREGFWGSGNTMGFSNRSAMVKNKYFLILITFLILTTSTNIVCWDWFLSTVLPQTPEEEIQTLIDTITTDQEKYSRKYTLSITKFSHQLQLLSQDTITQKNLPLNYNNLSDAIRNTQVLLETIISQQQELLQKATLLIKQLPYEEKTKLLTEKIKQLEPIQELYTQQLKKLTNASLMFTYIPLNYFTQNNNNKTVLETLQQLLTSIQANINNTATPQDTNTIDLFITQRKKEIDEQFKKQKEPEIVIEKPQVPLTTTTITPLNTIEDQKPLFDIDVMLTTLFKDIKTFGDFFLQLHTQLSQEPPITVPVDTDLSNFWTLLTFPFSSTKINQEESLLTIQEQECINFFKPLEFKNNNQIAIFYIKIQQEEKTLYYKVEVPQTYLEILKQKNQHFEPRPFALLLDYCNTQQTKTSQSTSTTSIKQLEPPATTETLCSSLKIIQNTMNNFTQQLLKQQKQQSKLSEETKPLETPLPQTTSKTLVPVSTKTPEYPIDLSEKVTQQTITINLDELDEQTKSIMSTILSEVQPNISTLLQQNSDQLMPLPSLQTIKATLATTFKPLLSIVTVPTEFIITTGNQIYNFFVAPQESFNQVAQEYCLKNPQNTTLCPKVAFLEQPILQRLEYKPLPTSQLPTINIPQQPVIIQQPKLLSQPIIQPIPLTLEIKQPVPPSIIKSPETAPISIIKNIESIPPIISSEAPFITITQPSRMVKKITDLTINLDTIAKGLYQETLTGKVTEKLYSLLPFIQKQHEQKSFSDQQLQEEVLNYIKPLTPENPFFYITTDNTTYLISLNLNTLEYRKFLEQPSPNNILSPHNLLGYWCSHSSQSNPDLCTLWHNINNNPKELRALLNNIQKDTRQEPEKSTTKAIAPEITTTPKKLIENSLPITPIYLQEQHPELHPEPSWDFTSGQLPEELPVQEEIKELQQKPSPEPTLLQTIGSGISKLVSRGTQLVTTGFNFINDHLFQPINNTIIQPVINTLLKPGLEKIVTISKNVVDLGKNVINTVMDKVVSIYDFVTEPEKQPEQPSTQPKTPEPNPLLTPTPTIPTAPLQPTPEQLKQQEPEQQQPVQQPITTPSIIEPEHKQIIPPPLPEKKDIHKKPTQSTQPMVIKKPITQPNSKEKKETPENTPTTKPVQQPFYSSSPGSTSKSVKPEQSYQPAQTMGTSSQYVNNNSYQPEQPFSQSFIDGYEKGLEYNDLPEQTQVLTHMTDTVPPQQEPAPQKPIQQPKESPITDSSLHPIHWDEPLITKTIHAYPSSLTITTKKPLLQKLMHYPKTKLPLLIKTAQLAAKKQTKTPKTTLALEPITPTQKTSGWWYVLWASLLSLFTGTIFLIFWQRTKKK
jgi:hypothetical protein